MNNQNIQKEDFVIQWTNKFSKEVGYVGGISTKNRCFYNSSQADAKRYKTLATAMRIVSTLREYGEAENNDFAIIAV